MNFSTFVGPEIYARMDILLQKKQIRQIKCISYDDFSLYLLNTQSFYHRLTTHVHSNICYIKK